jgi:hypothetical protein
VPHDVLGTWPGALDAGGVAVEQADVAMVELEAVRMVGDLRPVVQRVSRRRRV